MSSHELTVMVAGYHKIIRVPITQEHGKLDRVQDWCRDAIGRMVMEFVQDSVARESAIRQHIAAGGKEAACVQGNGSG